MRARRALKRIGVTFGVILALVGVAILALLLAPVRSSILRTALPRVSDALPGTLVVEEARWPGLGRLALTGILWTDGADTLLAADACTLEVDVSALAARDVVVPVAAIDGLRADVPAIRSRFPSASETTSDPGARSPSFPREGSIPGVPSIAVERARLTASIVRVDSTQVVRDAEARVRASFRHGSAPVIDARVRAREAGGNWRVDDLFVHVDLADRHAEGSGQASIGTAWPITMTLDTDDTGRLNLSVTTDGDPTPPGVHVVADVDYARGGFRGVEFKSSVRTPDTERLKSDPALAETLADLPSLAAIDARVDGEWRRDRGGALALAIDPNPWQRGGLARLRFENGVTAIDTVAIDLAGLSVRAGGTLGADEGSAEAEILLSSLEWLRAFGVADVPVDDVDVRARVRASGPAGAPDVEARVRGSLVASGTPVDDIVVDARLTDAFTRASFAAHATARDFTARVKGEALLHDADVDLSLSPVHVFSTFDPDTTRVDQIATVSRRNGAVTARGVSVVGSLGRLTGDVDAFADGTGTASIDWRLDAYPEFLGRALGWEAGVVDSVRAAWTDAGALEAEIAFGPRGRLHVDAKLVTPGPRIAQALAPAGVDLTPLGPIRARLAVRGNTAVRRLDLSLSDTDWVEAGTVRARTVGARTIVDTLHVAVAGAVLVAGGEVDDHLRARLTLAIDDSSLVRTLAPGPTDSLTAAVDMTVDTHHLLTDPVATARIDAAADGPAWDLPHVGVRAELDENGLGVVLAAGRGLRAGAVVLDTLDVAYRGAGRARGFLPGSLTMSAKGPEIAFGQRATIERAEAWAVVLDTFDLRLRGDDLAAVHPATITFDPAAETITVRDLDLAGSIGTAHVDGTAGPRDTNLDAAVRFTLPDTPPPALSVPPALWPRSVEIDAIARGTSALDVVATVTRLGVGAEDEIDLVARIRGRDDGLTASLTVGDSTDARLRGTASYPGSLRLYPPALTTRDGDMKAALVLKAFRWPADLRVEEGKKLRVDGEIAAEGSSADPRFQADVEASFPNWSRLARYRLRTVATYAAGSPATASLVLTDGDRSVADGRAELPLRWLGNPPWIELSRSEALSFALDTAPLPLADFNELLPPNTSVGGSTEVHVTADGPPETAALDGTARVRDLRIALADGSRILAQGDVSITGNVSRPEIRGDVRVVNGIVRVPEPPKNLLPREGQAVLWESGMRANATGAVAGTESRATPAFVSIPTLDVTVEIPSALWIRGQGLDIELAGNLRLVQSEESLPNLFGELDAVGGTLSLLGTRFTVQRGNVLFLGDDQLGPTLDIRLTHTIETTTVIVDVTGTAREPALDLRSEPEMSEGDIASLLLFGRRMDDLSGNEADLLEQRAGEVAVAMGSAALEEAIAGQLGVDMLRIETGTAGNTLVLGKYLSPRLLLQYEQALDDAGDFFINLEYLLTRHLRLESLVGRQNNSGIQLNWIREY